MDQRQGAFKGKLTLSWTEIITCAAFIVLGLVLLVVPGLATSVIFNVIGIGCIVIGIVHLIRYFRLEAQLALMSNDMALGLGWIIGGAAIIIFKSLLVSLLPILFGMMMLVGGVIKIQSTLGFRRMNAGRWYLELISAAISVVLGFLILANPFSTVLLLMRVIGISLVIEGIMDLVSRIAYKRARDRFIIEAKFED